MGFDEMIGQARSGKLIAGLNRSGVWILVSLVPIALLARLIALTLYSIPESDDFCLSYLNAANGFARTTWIWYNTLVGRIVPLILIQVPAAISGATGIDYFITYTATMIVLAAGFAAALVFAASRLWPQANFAQNIFMGAALAATILGGLPSLREMLYWLPGVTCYTLPGIIVLLVLGEFVQTAGNNATISPAATRMMAIGGFVAALCNEFTPVWLIGMILGSLAVRFTFFRGNIAIRQHAIVGGATLIGFMILLFAPGNSVRIAVFPMAKDFSRSIHEAYVSSHTDLRELLRYPWVRAWLIVAMLFTLTLPETVRGSAWKHLLLSVLVPFFCIACIYLAYFTAQYATGMDLAERAKNETVMLLIYGLTLATAFLARALSTSIPNLAIVARQRNSFAAAAIAIVLGAILVWPLNKSKTMNLLRSEQRVFDIFWLESMQRHTRLMLSTEQDVFVEKHNVHPTVLMGGDLTDNPSQLPNDCVAAFYRKKTIIAKAAAPAS